MSNLHQSVVDQVRTRLGMTLKNTWRIDALIGMGGMAAVYAATDRNGARAAIKMLHTALSINDGVRKRFAREGQAANSIGHPGIARVIDDGVAPDGSAFLVMELLEGETAAARAERHGGKLPVHEVAYIGEAVADVLAAAHAKNIIHRDVKPDNVFLASNGRIVVLDFGIARIEDAMGRSESGTRTGTMMGTPAFMPPEQARGRANEMDQASDVWALGATLFWLASGRVVHEAETPNEQLVAAATLPAASLARIAPDVPIPLVTVIDKALEFTKANRFADAVAMKHALHAAVLAVSWGVLPGLDGDSTVAEPPRNFTPLAAKLKPSGLDDATTLAMKSPIGMGASARGPTIGPVEVPPDKRSSKFVRAAVLGAMFGVLVLVVVGVIGRRLMTPQPELATSVSAPVFASTSVTAATASTSIATSVVVPVVETAPSATASATAQASAPPPTTTNTTTTARKNWLDRRK